MTPCFDPFSVISTNRKGTKSSVFQFPVTKALQKKYFQEYGEEYSVLSEEYEEYPDLLLKEGHCKGQFICLRH